MSLQNHEACTSDGILVCNGETEFGVCDHGDIVWRNVAAGTVCHDSQIVHEPSTPSSIELPSYANPSFVPPTDTFSVPTSAPSAPMSTSFISNLPIPSTFTTSTSTPFSWHDVPHEPTTWPHTTLTLQPPPPPTTASCDPGCNCATGGKEVPTEGRYLCGWCGAVTAWPNHFLNVTDLVVCKDNACCNYGRYDGRCERLLLEVPVNFDLW